MSHLALANAHSNFEVVAVCDSQAFLLAGVKSQMGIATYRNVDRMLAEQRLDCVYIATPTSSHFDLGMAVIEAGASLFIEKPLTLSYDQSIMLAEAAQAKGVAAQVGYHNRHVGTFREAARLVSEGAIGNIHHITGRAYGQVVTKESKGGLTWRSKRSAGGGCLHDYACHVIDLMNFLVGPPADIVGARLSSIFSIDTDDAVTALFRYPNGCTGLLETNWSDDSVRKMTTSVALYGAGGKMEVDRQELRLYLRKGNRFEGYDEGWSIRNITELQDPVWFYIRGEEYSAQVDAFAALITDKQNDSRNGFGSAAETDRIVEEIIRVDAVSRHSSGSPQRGDSIRHDARPTESMQRYIALPPWLGKFLDLLESMRGRAARMTHRLTAKWKAR